MVLRRAAAAVVLAAAASAAHAQLIFVSEGFDNVDTLAARGWVLTNASSPAGLTPGWFQGDQTIFPSFAGASNSYVAANFNNAAAGGTLANYLFSPAFTNVNGGTVTFWARSAGDAGFTDQLRVGLTHGAASIADFVQFGPALTLTSTWTQYSFTFPQAFGVTGRAVVEYFGAADTSDYVGVDSLTVNVVPEPETWALFALGLGALGAFTRRRRGAA